MTAAMNPISFATLEPPPALRRDVDYFRIAEYGGSDAVNIKVCPNGSPGICFHAGGDGGPAIDRIVTEYGQLEQPPSLFLYGHVTVLSAMHFRSGPFVTIQAVLKPNALKTLFRIDAADMANRSWEPGGFGAKALAMRLTETSEREQQVGLIRDFIASRLERAGPRDTLVEQSLELIRSHIEYISVKILLELLHVSERTFQRRFYRSTGVTPQFYIRVKRFNEAIRLMNTGRYERLSDVAQALQFHDQSHFIRDMREFSGITPRNVSQKVNLFHHDAIGNSYFI